MMSRSSLHAVVAVTAAVSISGCSRAEGPTTTTPPGPAAMPDGERREGPPPAVGAAREPAPAPLLELPARLSLDLTVSYEHGCSQSHEGISSSASLVLEISQDGEAVLLWELDEVRSFGPSPGRFREGDRDFSASHRRVRRVWTGPAERTDDGLVVRFVEARNAAAERRDAGRPVLPEPTVAPSVSVLACRPGSVQAYEAATDRASLWQTDGQTATSLPVFLCAMSETLSDFEREVTVDGALPLAPDPGLLANASIFFSEPRVIYRRAAAPATE